MAGYPESFPWDLASFMSELLMECGHTANAKREIEKGKYIPCCAICAGGSDDKKSITVAENVPNLEGREASCSYCGKKVPSSFSLAFFEYRGPKCSSSESTCVNCGRHKSFHEKDHWMYEQHKKKCDNFQPGYVWETDNYYCGCFGWN